MSREHGPHRSGDRPAVWLVDDSDGDVARARAALESDYSITTFSDGAPALERLADGDVPNVLVIDWMMPGVDGLEVCRYVRSVPALERIAIILLTVHDAPDEIRAGLEAGANDFVVKPFDEVELRARVSSLIRTQRLLERAERAEARFNRLVEESPDALIALDDDGLIAYVNAAAERSLGTSTAEVHGQSLGELLPELASWDLSRPDPPDVHLPTGLYAPVVRRVDKGPAILSLRDVTLKRQAEERRLDLYSMVAHDLRTPLQALMVRGELLRDRVDSESEELVEGMLTSTRRLVQMIDDFMTLARDQSARTPVDSIDFAALVEAEVEELAPLASLRGIDLRFARPDSPVLVTGDLRRLRQVPANLIGNALKFTEPGGAVEVVVALGAGHCSLTVRDTGIGMPASALEHVFHRYTRVDDGRIGGSGLGLMIVRQTVEAHRGTVEVTSEEGKGSTFRVSLPLEGAVDSR